MILASPHSLIDKNTATVLGARYMEVIWKDSAANYEISAKRQGDVWILMRTGLKGYKSSSGDILEPLTILINANDGTLCGGSMIGYPTALHNLGHEISRATTKDNMDVTSLFHWQLWDEIRKSAKPMPMHRSFPFIEVHELLGEDVEVNTDGTFTVNRRALRPAEKYRKFLRSLAQFSRKSHFPAVKVIPRMK